MSTRTNPATERRWTATELRRLPAAERDAILAAAADVAVEENLYDAELTAFETFGEGDLYGDSAGAATRRDMDG